MLVLDMTTQVSLILDPPSTIEMVIMSFIASTAAYIPVFATPACSFVFLFVLPQVGTSDVTVTAAKWRQLHRIHRSLGVSVTIRA